jgi:hypothetical protein
MLTTVPQTSAHFQPLGFPCVLDTVVLVFTARVGTKYELFSQGILFALGTGTGRNLLELGNKLSFEHSELSVLRIYIYRKHSCYFSIFIKPLPFLRLQNVPGLRQAFHFLGNHRVSICK